MASREPSPPATIKVCSREGSPSGAAVIRAPQELAISPGAAARTLIS